MYITFKSLCVFRSRGPEKITMHVPGDATSQCQFPQRSTSRTASRLLTENTQPQRLLQQRLNHDPDFLKVRPKMTTPPPNKKQSRKKNAHIPKRKVWMFLVISGGLLKVLNGNRKKEEKGIRFK